MTLQQALKAKALVRLIPYVGWMPCGRLTGRYFYDYPLERKPVEEDLKVEISSGFPFFEKNWVFLKHLQEVQEVGLTRQQGINTNPDPTQSKPDLPPRKR